MSGPPREPRNPKVSVLIPTYNKAPFLGEAVGSVLAQTFEDYELIIVDDASQDETQSVVTPFLSDPRVTYFENERNLGIGGNWNRALSMARGEYVKYLMGDDKFHPELLERFVPIMDAHPGVALVTSHRGFIGDESGHFEQPMTGLCPGQEVIRRSFYSGNWMGEPTTVMFRRSNLWLGYFNVAYQFVLDWDMWFRHLTQGDLFVVPEVLSYFRKNEGQQTRKMQDTYRDLFEEHALFRSVLSAPHLYGIDEDRKARKRIRQRTSGLYKRIPRMVERRQYRLALRSLEMARREGVLCKVAVKASMRLLRRVPFYLFRGLRGGLRSHGQG